MNISNTIKAIIILQADGRRLVVKYYDDQLNSRQFEREIFSKTKTPKANPIVYKNQLVVHEFSNSHFFFVVGAENENPMILFSVLSCLIEVISTMAKNVNGNPVLDNISHVILALDEICDGGLILEINPSLVLQRISSSNEEWNEWSAHKTVMRMLW